MAMVLICLIAGHLSHNDLFYKLAVFLLVIDMIVPKVYRPVAVVWLGLSRLLGTVISRTILTVVFFVFVVPTGMVRRLFGRDSLQLKKFKTGPGSVMKKRDHTYVPADVEKPY